MDKHLLLDEKFVKKTVSEQKLFESARNICFFIFIIASISFFFVHRSSYPYEPARRRILSEYSSFLSNDDNKYDLLSYNFKVKQNIIDALRSDEKMSEEIAPLVILRELYMTAPSFHLSLCPITKSMSTVTMNMFCYLYDPVGFIRKNHSISTSIWSERLCQYTNEFTSYEDLQKQMGGEFYNTITIVRDPLSRFISGFLDKCVRKRHKCFGCDLKDMMCALTELRKILMTRPKNVTYDNTLYAMELLHMLPQTWYCEMRKDFEHMIFIKYGQSGKEHERMVQEISIALNITKVPHQHIEYIENELRRNGRTSHSTEKMDLKKVFLEEFTTRVELRDLFWSIYENDYKIFDFQPPK